MLRIADLRFIRIFEVVIGSTIAAMSVWVGYNTNQIQTQISNNASQDARISRSVALSQSIYSDPAFRQVLVIGHSIEAASAALYDKYLEVAGKIDEDAKTELALKARAQAAFNLANSPDQHVFFVSLLQDVRRASFCTGYNSVTAKHGQPGVREKGVCDPETFFQLMGPIFSDIFFQVRAKLACDRRIASRTLNDYYSLVYAYETAFEERNGIKIFKLSEDIVNEDLNNGNYRVVEFNTDFCEYYNG